MGKTERSVHLVERGRLGLHIVVFSCISPVGCEELNEDSRDNCVFVTCIRNLTIVTSASDRMAYSRELVSSLSSRGTDSGDAMTRFLIIVSDGGSRITPSSPSKSSL